MMKLALLLRTRYYYNSSNAFSAIWDYFDYRSLYKQDV